jgi:hypothetical protein
MTLLEKKKKKKDVAIIFFYHKLTNTNININQVHKFLALYLCNTGDENDFKHPFSSNLITTESQILMGFPKILLHSDAYIKPTSTISWLYTHIKLN